MPAELPPLPEELPDSLRFETEPHHPDEVVPPRGVFSLAVLALVVGPGFGWLVQRFSGVGCLGALFSATFSAVLLLGQPLAQFGTSAVRWGRVRRPWLAGAVALLMLTTMALGHKFGIYQVRRTQLANQLQGEGKKPAEIQAELDRFTFDNFLLEEEGWGLLWLAVPVLLVGRHGARTLARTAARPFCPLCQDWKRPLQTGSIKVQGTPEALRRLVADGELMRLAHYTKAAVPGEADGDWVMLPPGKRLYDPDAPAGVLLVHTCPCRAPEATAEVELLIDGKSDGLWSYPASALAVFREIGRRPIESIPEDEDDEDEDEEE